MKAVGAVVSSWILKDLLAETVEGKKKKVEKCPWSQIWLHGLWSTHTVYMIWVGRKEERSFGVGAQVHLTFCCYLVGETEGRTLVLPSGPLLFSFPNGHFQEVAENRKARGLCGKGVSGQEDPQDVWGCANHASSSLPGTVHVERARKTWPEESRGWPSVFHLPKNTWD